MTDEAAAAEAAEAFEHALDVWTDAANEFERAAERYIERHLEELEDDAENAHCHSTAAFLHAWRRWLDAGATTHQYHIESDVAEFREEMDATLDEGETDG